MCKKIKLARNTTTYANNRGSMASGSKCTTSVRSHPVIRRNRNICIAARINICIAARIIKSMARATALAPKLALFILTGTDIYRERYLQLVKYVIPLGGELLRGLQKWGGNNGSSWMARNNGSSWMATKTKDCYLYLLIIEIKVNIIGSG
jgi:hypothetical protein